MCFYSYTEITDNCLLEKIYFMFKNKYAYKININYINLAYFE